MRIPFRKTLGSLKRKLVGAGATPKTGYGIYHSAIFTLLATRSSVRAVVVGANDGALNDPLYPIITKFPERFGILLIEPQPSLLPHLRKNYEFHSAPLIHQGAVGPEGTLTLYAISEDAWSHIAVPYAPDWPIYRAPTGVTSANRTQVRAWLSKNYKGREDIDRLIQPLSVSCRPLSPLLETYGWGQGEIDLLQVDTEGFDDQVLLSSNLAITRPKVINFETNSLPAERKLMIMAHLSNLGYTIIEYSIEALAVLVTPTTRL